MVKAVITPVVAPSAPTILSPTLNNASGAVMPSFSVVALNANGAIVLARANSPETSVVVGVAEGEVGVGEGVKISVGGVVGYQKDPDSEAISSGMSLYLSPFVAGAVTATKPTAPNLAVIVGKAIGSQMLIGISAPTEITQAATLETEEIPNNSGEVVIAYSAVTIDASGSMVMADASNEPLSRVVGFVTDSIANGGGGRIQIGGVTGIRYEPGADAPISGNKLFLSDTEPGTLTKVPPTTSGSVIVLVGTLAGSELAIEINRGIALT
mgnify:CR=1 FL=1